MFHVYQARTADEAWRAAWADITDDGLTRPNTQAGGSRELHHVVLSLEDPRQRWVGSRRPALNPAFALAEVIWIVRGRRDARFLTSWNTGLPAYVGSSSSLHGAYGYRLRNFFGIDQIERAWSALANVPDSRQIVLNIWDPMSDLPAPNGRPNNRDIPCNICALLKVREERLEWLQIMRSNDILLGLPYNIVQWTTLQEIFAGWLGLDVGHYNHVSDSLHRYDNQRAAFDVDDHPFNVSNTDDLRLPRDQSNYVFAVLDDVASDLIDHDPVAVLSEQRVNELPRPYLNWIRVMAYERLRRRGAAGEAAGIKQEIDNPVLRSMIDLWRARFERTADV